jgi:hypothetical protein
MNSRLAFVVFGSFYFFVLLASYLLVLFYPFFTPYGWFLVPVVANFFVGYLVKEVNKAIEIIIAYVFLHVGIIIGLLNVSSVYDAFLSMHTHSMLLRSPFSAWIIAIIFIYYLVHISLGIAISYVGITVRGHSRLLLGRSIKVKFLFVTGILLSMGIVSTRVSSDFYRFDRAIYTVGLPQVTVKIISCGFPLPYLHVTNSSWFNFPQAFGIQPFNHTNFLLNTLFYATIYSAITVFWTMIARWHRHSNVVQRK